PFEDWTLGVRKHYAAEDLVVKILVLVLDRRPDLVNVVGNRSSSESWTGQVHAFGQFLRGILSNLFVAYLHRIFSGLQALDLQEIAIHVVQDRRPFQDGLGVFWKERQGTVQSREGYGVGADRRADLDLAVFGFHFAAIDGHSGNQSLKIESFENG